MSGLIKLLNAAAGQVVGDVIFHRTTGSNPKILAFDPSTGLELASIDFTNKGGATGGASFPISATRTIMYYADDDRLYVGGVAANNTLTLMRTTQKGYVVEDGYVVMNHISGVTMVQQWFTQLMLDTSTNYMWVNLKGYVGGDNPYFGFDLTSWPSSGSKNANTMDLIQNDAIYLYSSTTSTGGLPHTFNTDGLSFAGARTYNKYTKSFAMTATGYSSNIPQTGLRAFKKSKTHLEDSTKNSKYPNFRYSLNDAFFYQSGSSNPGPGWVYFYRGNFFISGGSGSNDYLYVKSPYGFYPSKIFGGNLPISHKVTHLFTREGRLLLHDTTNSDLESWDFNDDGIDDFLLSHELRNPQTGITSYGDVGYQHTKFLAGNPGNALYSKGQQTQLRDVHPLGINNHNLTSYGGGWYKLIQCKSGKIYIISKEQTSVDNGTGTRSGNRWVRIVELKFTGSGNDQSYTVEGYKDYYPSTGSLSVFGSGSSIDSYLPQSTVGNMTDSSKEWNNSTQNDFFTPLLNKKPDDSILIRENDNIYKINPLTATMSSDIFNITNNYNVDPDISHMSGSQSVGSYSYDVKGLEMRPAGSDLSNVTNYTLPQYDQAKDMFEHTTFDMIYADDGFIYLSVRGRQESGTGSTYNLIHAVIKFDEKTMIMRYPQTILINFPVAGNLYTKYWTNTNLFYDNHTQNLFAFATRDHDNYPNNTFGNVSKVAGTVWASRSVRPQIYTSQYGGQVGGWESWQTGNDPYFTPDEGGTVGVSTTNANQLFFSMNVGTWRPYLRTITNDGIFTGRIKMAAMNGGSQFEGMNDPASPYGYNHSVYENHVGTVTNYPHVVNDTPGKQMCLAQQMDVSPSASDSTQNEGIHDPYGSSSYRWADETPSTSNTGVDAYHIAGENQFFFPPTIPDSFGSQDTHGPSMYNKTLHTQIQSETLEGINNIGQPLFRSRDNTSYYDNKGLHGWFDRGDGKNYAGISISPNYLLGRLNTFGVGINVDNVDSAIESSNGDGLRGVWYYKGYWHGVTSYQDGTYIYSQERNGNHGTEIYGYGSGSTASGGGGIYQNADLPNHFVSQCDSNVNTYNNRIYGNNVRLGTDQGVRNVDWNSCVSPDGILCIPKQDSGYNKAGFIGVNLNTRDILNRSGAPIEQGLPFEVPSSLNPNNRQIMQMVVTSSNKLWAILDYEDPTATPVKFRILEAQFNSNFTSVTWNGYGSGNTGLITSNVDTAATHYAHLSQFVVGKYYKITNVGNINWANFSFDVSNRGTPQVGDTFLCGTTTANGTGNGQASATVVPLGHVFFNRTVCANMPVSKMTHDADHYTPFPAT
tara:strand:- start:252 stop:4199 length:3948 start_codon:yes stop_codon:yes gene_type:complete